MLVAMFNNRAYCNDWEHQERIARHRGTDARGLGWHGEGPINDPDGVESAVRRAADVVAGEARPALVDVVCQPQ